MSERTRSIIPFRAKLAVGVVALLAVLASTDGFKFGKEPDYSDTDKYRLAAYHVEWTWYSNTRPKVLLRWNIGSNKGASPGTGNRHVENGYVKQGQIFTISAGVEHVSEQRLSHILCTAYVDGNPVKVDVVTDAGKMIHCTAVAAW